MNISTAELSALRCIRRQNCNLLCG